jgi:excisionase family DNA binding protein
MSVPDGTPAPSPPPPQPPRPSGPGRAADDYLRVGEVAELLHCHPTTVYELIYAGALPSYNLAKPGAKQASLRVARSDVHAFMAARRIQIAA